VALTKRLGISDPKESDLSVAFTKEDSAETASLRDARYFAARVRAAQVIASPTDTVAFGSTVTFKRDDGRVQKYRIVGEDEAEPKAGSISFVSPVARLLMGKAVGDVAGTSGQELEIISIS
jgi:transcription elongation GreA/GreB family factor